MTWLIFALTATILTSFLPICNKQLLRTQTPALVAWKINTFSLPLLAIGTWLFTQCRFDFSNGSLACAAQLPQVDLIFIIALSVSAILNWGATLLSTYALKYADASLVTPLLTFNPTFTVLIAWIVLSEQPGIREAIGIIILLIGAYLLDVQEVHTNLLAPLQTLLRCPGILLALLASALWGTTTVLEKVAIEHVHPSTGPLVALASTIITAMLLTPGAWFAYRATVSTKKPVEQESQQTPHYTLLIAVILASVAPLFGFTAIAQGYVGYVTAIFKLSAVLTILWAKLLLGEGNLRSRLPGACVMLLGAALIA